MTDIKDMVNYFLDDSLLHNKLLFNRIYFWDTKNCTILSDLYMIHKTRKLYN
jgi:hypothetical protein